MNIEIEVLEHNNSVEVNVCGEIDAYTAPKLRDALYPFSTKEKMKIIVNLKDVVYMDSTGLGVLVGIFKNIRSNQGELQIIGLTGRLKRLFEITGLADIMNINSRIEGEAE
ncbi:anti-sigma factor antagonist [Robertmurraya andreesenii]|uniref:Anti-sigma factor antagonist n=1 Tax=Anoxybacillus andreesenii TaxID=1325932 RepID=A0ABT9V3W8_9BACL|nr:anti-sigma factor antagonist [Robertmurraya andreesenii]MDQ0155647.1 anti-sigma B factor antagonist [Robertmurraya andreesenii]